MTTPTPLPVLAARRPTARLVLEYLMHQGHTQAAQALGRDLVPVAPASHEPSSSSETVQQMNARQRMYYLLMPEILKCISNGHIEKARLLCEQVFPAVLREDPAAVCPAAEADCSIQVVKAESEFDAQIEWAMRRPLDPRVLRLHMAIQGYVEEVRTLIRTGEEELADTMLVQMQDIHQRVAALPASLQQSYRPLVQELAALMASRSRVDIPPHRMTFFELSRRSVLAAQINYAILASQGTTPEPLLMRAAQQAIAAWDSLHTRRVPVPLEHPATEFMRSQGVQVPSRGPDKIKTTTCPSFQLSKLARDRSLMRASLFASPDQWAL
ncbi:hypothetical protein MEQU1_003724 [Malassezia equina]|uniref:LisH domain-containing protein n=1 Tax=Malassezia equina TaxID=1381935 RepID=A0AAF0J5H7_9BASI|nr:hypothetical protein MEQU1_003724 [Malassezia equina]